VRPLEEGGGADCSAATPHEPGLLAQAGAANSAWSWLPCTSTVAPENLSTRLINFSDFTSPIFSGARASCVPHRAPGLLYNQG
jgi:hypothetical protein